MIRHILDKWIQPEIGTKLTLFVQCIQNSNINRTDTIVTFDNYIYICIQIALTIFLQCISMLRTKWTAIIVTFACQLGMPRNFVWPWPQGQGQILYLLVKGSTPNCCTQQLQTLEVHRLHIVEGAGQYFKWTWCQGQILYIFSFKYMLDIATLNFACA